MPFFSLCVIILAKVVDSMEFLIELLIEIFGELFMTLIAEGIGAFARRADSDDNLRKGLRYGLTYSILGLTILLITLSLIYSKTFLVIIAVSYLLIILLITLFKWLNADLWESRKVKITMEIVKRIIHYAYPILLIVLGSIYLTDLEAILALDLISSIAIIAWFSVDMFKLWRYNKNKNGGVKNDLHYDDKKGN